MNPPSVTVDTPHGPLAFFLHPTSVAFRLPDGVVWTVNRVGIRVHGHLTIMASERASERSGRSVVGNWCWSHYSGPYISRAHGYDPVSHGLRTKVGQVVTGAFRRVLEMHALWHRAHAVHYLNQVSEWKDEIGKLEQSIQSIKTAMAVAEEVLTDDHKAVIAELLLGGEDAATD